MRRLRATAAAGLLALAATPGPAAATEMLRYAGHLTFAGGQPTCSPLPGTVTMEVGSDGGMRGSVTTAAGSAAFFGTVSPGGKLTASYRAAEGVESTRVEGAFVDDRFDGFARSRSCRYHLDLTRRDGNSSEEK